MNSVEQQPYQRSDQLQDDEIDLLELFATLWQGKWIVLGCVLLTAVPIGIWLKLQAPIYSIEAVIESLTAHDLRIVQPSILEGGEAYQTSPIEPEQVYESAITRMQAINTQAVFWEAHTGRALPQGLVREDGEISAFRDFVESLTVVVPSTKSEGELAIVRVTLESPSPKTDVVLLNGFLEFTNRSAASRYLAELRSAYELNLQQLEFDYQAAKSLAATRIEDQLVRLREAYDLAKGLGIEETPYEQFENVALTVLDNRLYLLGTRVLQQEIASLEARKEKPLESFVDQLRRMQTWKAQIENDLRRLEVAKAEARAFEIVSRPATSLSPIKPNKLLIFIAACFVAGIVGVLIVFVREGMRSYKARHPVEG